MHVCVIYGEPWSPAEIAHQPGDKVEEGNRNDTVSWEYVNYIHSFQIHLSLASRSCLDRYEYAVVVM
jgi:hypothetical protein